MKLFSNKKKAGMIQNLLDLKNRPDSIKAFTTFQNEISIAHNTKVVAIAAVDEDDLASAFAFALSATYESNGSSALLVDANLYDPKLKDMLKPNGAENGKVFALSEKTGAVFMNKEIYPSNIYKEGVIHGFAKEGLNTFEHIIIIVPAVKFHKEVSLLSNIIDSVVLVTRRDVTKKRDIYESLQFLASEKLPVSKTVILK